MGLATGFGTASFFEMFYLDLPKVGPSDKGGVLRCQSYQRHVVYFSANFRDFWINIHSDKF